MIEHFSLEDVSRKADALVSRMESEFGKPDLVVAIANGGLYVGDLIAKATDAKLKWISIGKDLDLGNLYKNKSLPHQMARVGHGYRFLTRAPKIKDISEMPESAELILLIDDTVHTGRTFQLAYAALKEKFPDALIVTAAINSVRGKGVDIVLHDRKRIWFPWSKHSPEYAEYRKRLAELGLADIKDDA